MADAWTTMRLLSSAPTLSDAWVVLNGVTNNPPSTAQIAAAVALSVWGAPTRTLTENNAPLGTRGVRITKLLRNKG